MNSIQGPAIKAFKAPTYPRFAATISREGIPNVVPLLSAKMIAPNTIAFVRFMIWKTKKNLEANRKITFACSGPRGRSYAAKCEFEGWVRQGPLLEQFENEPIYRYNAYAGANEVGVVRVKQVHEFPGTGFIWSALTALGAKVGAGNSVRFATPSGIKAGGRFLLSEGRDTVKGKIDMPIQVVEKWRRVIAFKFMGMVDKDGDPIAFPLRGLSALDPGTLAFPMPKEGHHPLHRLAPGDLVAASVLVLDPVAYQVKGRFAGTHIRNGRKMAAIEITEVYSAAPPVPGKRISPPETYPLEPRANS